MMQDLIQIKAVVESEFNNINISLKTRERKFCDALKIYANIASKCTKHTRSTIGAFVNRNHSTISVAIKKFEDLMETDPDFFNKARFCSLKCINLLNKETASYKQKIDIVFPKLNNSQQEELYLKASDMYATNTKEINYV